jgi:hypothetical protein
VALVMEKYTELLSGGELAGRWKGVELKEITPWEVRSNYILVFNEEGRKRENTHAEGDVDCALRSLGNALSKLSYLRLVATTFRPTNLNRSELDGSQIAVYCQSVRQMPWLFLLFFNAPANRASIRNTGRKILPVQHSGNYIFHLI